MNEIHGTLRLRLTLVGRTFPFRGWLFERALPSPLAWPTWDAAGAHFTKRLEGAGGPSEDERTWRLEAMWEPEGSYTTRTWFIDRPALCREDLPDSVRSGVNDLAVVVERSWREHQERREIARLQEDSSDA